MNRFFSRERLPGTLAGLVIVVLLTAPLWQTAASVLRDDAWLHRDAHPRFSFTAPGVKVDHVPAKIERMSGGAMWNGSGGIVTPVRPFVVRVTSRGWNLLVATEPWSSNWRVYWNGQRLPPVRVGDRVGTFVPPGDGTIELRYRASAFDDGLRLAAIGLVLLLVRLRWKWERPIARGVARIWSAAAMPPLWLALLFLAYAVVLIVHRVDVAGGSDSSGYLNEAKLWHRGPLIVKLPPELPEARRPLGFVRGPQPGTMVPSYPPGLPLMLALLRAVGGEEAQFFLIPLFAAGAVLLLDRLGHELELSMGWSACAAATLALAPPFVFHAIQVMSDVAAAFWAIAAMLCAFRGAKDARFAALAGATLGVGVLVRPTQILLLPTIVVALGLRRRQLLALVAGGLPFAIAQLAISHHLYGSAFTTGYGSIFGELRWSYFPPRFVHYTFWLGALLSPLVFPLGFAGFRRRAALALWFVPFFLFYCFYGPYEFWWYTRFLLPAIPAMILGAAFVLRRWPIPLMLAVFALQLGICWKFDVITFAYGERTYRAAARLAADRVPPGAIFVAMQESGSLYYYTGRFALRYDAITPQQFATLDGEVYALVGKWELDELRKRTGAEWIDEAGVNDVVLLRRYHPRRDVAALRGAAVPHVRAGAPVLRPGGRPARQVPRELPGADGALPLAGRAARSLDPRGLGR